MIRSKVLSVIDKLSSGITTKGYLKHYDLKEGDVVVDAGAYIGNFTILAAKRVGNSGKVIAFEPGSKNCKILRENIEREGLKNVIVMEKALFNKYGEVNLSNHYWQSSIVWGENSRKRGEVVKCGTLDKELKRLKISKVDFIKMDVEGADLEVIEGSRKTLQNTKNFAIACYHLRDGKWLVKSMRPTLHKMGFKTKMGFWIHPTLYGRKT